MELLEKLTKRQPVPSLLPPAKVVDTLTNGSTAQNNGIAPVGSSENRNAKNNTPNKRGGVIDQEIAQIMVITIL